MLIVTGFVGILTVTATALGVYFVWRTLGATQQIASDTREIGEAQVRAYLTVGDIVAIPESISKEGCLFKIHMNIANSGQSPARNVLAHIEEDGRVGTIVGDIASGQSEKTNVFPYIGVEDLTFFRSSETDVQFQITVHISFDDVFSKDGHRRREHFDFVGKGPLVKEANIPLIVVSRQSRNFKENEQKHLQHSAAPT